MFMDTIEKPWKHPIDYITLVFWFVLFVIVAFAMADGLRVLTLWITSAAKEVVE